jgi:hypothetical protein
MNRTTIFLVGTLCASAAFGDNSDCGAYVNKLETATTITINTGQLVEPNGERAKEIESRIYESKRAGLSDCEILNELKPLLSKTR